MVQSIRPLEPRPSAVAQVRSFVARGGRLIFGTDVGYVPDYDPSDEYRLLARAGLGFHDVLAVLNTSPNESFEGPGSGTVESRQPADLVLLSSDPAEDMADLADVRYVIKDGKVSFGLP